MSDFDTVKEEWRTVPTDLGGWANRASQMMRLAEAAEARVTELEEALTDCAGSAGNPDAAQGCRTIIARVRAALEGKT